MSPEAFDEAKSYTAKLDIIFGVIVIEIFSFQIQLIDIVLFMILAITKKFQLVVPEIEQHQAHLQLIQDTHSLKPLVLQCMKKEMQRSSALQLSVRLS